MPAAVAAAAFVAPSSAAAELRLAVHEGSTCYGYPPYRDDLAIPHQYRLYGIDQGAYCPIRADDQMQAQHLYLVFVYGMNISVRLCVHRYGQWVQCGAAKSIGPSLSSTWVLHPSTTPGVPTGAFLSVSFIGGVSTVDEYDALWSIPE